MSTPPDLPLRVCILAPTLRDAQITESLLIKAGLTTCICETIADARREIARGAGAILATEEALTAPGIEDLLTELERQPSWSELPFIMLMRGGTESPTATKVLSSLRNVTLLERPAPMRSVVSAVQAAVRGRQRQYQIRDQIDATSRSEMRSADLQRQLEIAIDASQLGTFHCEFPLDKIIWNDRCKAHFWLPPDAEVDFDRFFAILHPDDRDRTRAAIDGCVTRGERYDIEYRTVSPAGQTRWIRASGRTYYDLKGNPTQFDGTTIDVTEKKQIEQDRERLLDSERAARTEAERASRVKDEFLATVSHELRTPLNAILGWTQLLKAAGDDPATVQEAVDVIDRNALLQAQLIEDLLDMSRIITGKIRLKIEPVRLAAVIAAAIDSVRPAATAKDIRITARIIDDINPIPADSGRLQQVLWNLLSNAVKFTPKAGTIDVSLRHVHSHAQICVADSGQGMAPDFLPHVFERFRQADGSTARHHGGLGLGLAIVKQLAELHGGTVWAHSPGTGKGSTFFVDLPIAAVRTASPASPPSLDLPMGRAKVEFADLRGIKVLVVDDDPDARRLLKRLLSDCKADVTTAASAAEALDLLQTFRPNVLISDIGMPGMDGYEFIAKVRTRASADLLPAAAVTAFARLEDRAQALTAGYQTHMTKPVEPSQLIAVVAGLAKHKNVN